MESALSAPGVPQAIGQRRFAANHRTISEPEAVAVLRDYEARNRWLNPVVHRGLSWLLRWRYNGSDDTRHRLARHLPIVACRPAA